MGHSVTMNESTYKKRQGIQTQIDVLTQSNKQAIDFTSGLLEAKQIIKKYPNSSVAIVELISKIYQNPFFASINIVLMQYMPEDKNNRGYRMRLRILYPLPY